MANLAAWPTCPIRRSPNAQHVGQRGNNRPPASRMTPTTAQSALLHEAMLDADAALHACVLMDNHVHQATLPPISDRVFAKTPRGARLLDRGVVAEVRNGGRSK